MRYGVQFANNRVGQAVVDPFDVEVPDSLFGVARNADLSRRIRERAVAALTASPAAGAVTSDSIALSSGTQVFVDTGTGEGVVYYGTTVLGTILIHPIG